MKTYTFKMTRVYETLIEINAENHADAVDKLDELGDEIYSMELEQCNVTKEEFEYVQMAEKK